LYIYLHVVCSIWFALL